MNNFHIFIASCFEGIDVQIPRLVENILETNIPVEYVHIIVGGCPIEKEYNISGIEIVQVLYRCFEFTPHIYILNNQSKYNFDFGFFTHDTVSFGKKFYDIMKNKINYLRTTNFDTMRIDVELPSMNIGVYSKNIILKNNATLLALCLNTNNSDELLKLKHKLVHYEDFILKQNNYYDPCNKAINIPRIFEGINGIKSNGLIRNFNNIDFIKYQSNANYIQSIDICVIDK